MLIDVIILISIGFMIGLSGAIIPGPLFTFTVLHTSKKRKITGHLIIFGHIIWELLIILIILFRFGGFLIENRLIIYVIGGCVLILMSFQIIKKIIIW